LSRDLPALERAKRKGGSRLKAGMTLEIAHPFA